MGDTLQVFSPIDGSLYLERPLGTWADVDASLTRAVNAQRAWRREPLATRVTIVERALAVMKEKAAEWGLETTWQMGRPVRYTPNEVRTAVVRGTTMVGLAEDALAPVVPASREGFECFIERTPLGVVAVLPAWNYPYLVAINTVVPALLAGNAVVIKPSETAPLVAERFAEAFAAAGLPSGLLEVLHLTHDVTARLIGDRRVAFVAFTGSVAGGHAVAAAMSGSFAGLGLELGGKDPAYVRADAEVSYAVENLVDGTYFNSGQSCCGVERIYVHASVYPRFVDDFVSLAKQYVLGDPRESTTTLGPMARETGAATVRMHIDEAVSRGARALIDPSTFAAHTPTGRYLAPQVLVDVDHSMRVMQEETFGPVVGIMRVDSDDEALRLMNDSRYGLTASLWTRDVEAAQSIGQELDTGTVFMNRCDYLDPELAWVGVKDSGRGCTLSRVGFEQLTRPRSFHLRTRT